MTPGTEPLEQHVAGLEDASAQPRRQQASSDPGATDRLPRPSDVAEGGAHVGSQRRTIDADDVGAHVGEEHPAVRTRRQAREVENAETFEWAGHGEGESMGALVPMTKRAAFFDLDRTLLGDSSGPVDHGRHEGARSDLGPRAGPGRRRTPLLQARRRNMDRHAAHQALAERIAGWSRQDLRDAAARSIDKLDAAVYQEARTLIQRHQERGHLVSSRRAPGRDIVEPLADRLGVDRLIATEYEEDSRAVYTGNLIGKWLWGPDKAEAVKAFCEREKIDLDESYAYSDSYYDRHLLEMVGYPRVVNPDASLRAYAVRKGWPVLGFKNREGTPKIAPELYDLLRPLATSAHRAGQRRRRGRSAHPSRGSGHHRGQPPVVPRPGCPASWPAGEDGSSAISARKRCSRRQCSARLMRALGQIRVERGTGDITPLQQAIDALGRGQAIGIFPQGTIPRGRDFFEPRLRGRTGVARSAWRLMCRSCPSRCGGRRGSGRGTAACRK